MLRAFQLAALLFALPLLRAAAQSPAPVAVQAVVTTSAAGDSTDERVPAPRSPSASGYSGAGTIVGGIVGGAAGMGIGILVAASQSNNCSGDMCGLANAIAGAALGESVGLAIGAHVGSRNRSPGHIILTSLAATGTLVGGTLLGASMGSGGVVMIPLVPIFQLAIADRIERF